MHSSSMIFKLNLIVHFARESIVSIVNVSTIKDRRAESTKYHTLTL